MYLYRMVTKHCSIIIKWLIASFPDEQVGLAASYFQLLEAKWCIVLSVYDV